MKPGPAGTEDSAVGRPDDGPAPDAIPADDPQTHAEEEALEDMASRRGDDDGGVDEEE